MKAAPIYRFYIGVAFSLVLAAIALGIALEERWLGVNLAVRIVDGASTVVVDHVSPVGPAAGRIMPGSKLVALIGWDGQRIEIDPADLMKEPDILDSHATMRAFFARQGRLADLVHSPSIKAELVTPFGATVLEELTPRRQRPVSDLPSDIWILLGVGLSGFWIGLWIWTLRPGEWATRCLAITGAALMTSAFAAAPYSARELATGENLFATLSGLNAFGSLSFGVGMIGLFLVYPRQFVRPAWLFVPALVLGTWLYADLAGVTGSPALGRHLAILTAMLTILVLVFLQVWASWRSPVDMAALTWLGLAVVIGAGAFVVTATVPALLGVEAVIEQAEAFLFFLLIYTGVALGVARFRLFELGEWAFRILFYLVGVLLLIVLDAVLILTIVDERVPAFALSLVIVGVVWLPLRDTVGRYLTNRRTPQLRNLFRQVMNVSLTPPDENPLVRWQELIRSVYAPLNMRMVDNVDKPRLVEDGAALLLPASGRIPAMRIEYAHDGRKLFTSRDLELADELVAMLSSAEDSRAAYERGVSQERKRIARDIHDNIGVQLLSVLHSPDLGRKDMMVRETLTDLRDIINNASHPHHSLEEMLADLRAETFDHLQAASVSLVWHVNVPDCLSLPLTTLQALRSIIREAVQNVLKHANASQMTIKFGVSGTCTTLEISDNGKGFDVERRRVGNGLDNMRSRVEALGGIFTLDSSGGGTRLRSEIPSADPIRTTS